MNLADAVLDYLPVDPGPRSVLIAGSGPEPQKEWLERGWVVTRLDVEPRTQPDIIADMTNMGEIGQYDAVFCCHALEHLYPHQVYPALCEFKRVLKPGGMAVVIVPDLEDVRPTEERLNIAECGPISGLHLFYGDPAQIAQYPHMAHHSGFVATTLGNAMKAAGFDKVVTDRLINYNLVGVGVKL